MAVLDLQQALDATNAFLDPVLGVESRRNKPTSTFTVAVRLTNSTGAEPESDSVARCVDMACYLLLQAHGAVQTWDSQNQDRQGAAVQGSVLIRNVYCLLDIIIILGLYPAMAVYSRIPFDRRSRSVIFPPDGPLPDVDVNLFYSVLAKVLPIAADFNIGLAPLARDQAMLDLVVASLFPSVTPIFPACLSGGAIYQAGLDIIDRAATSKVLPTLVSLIGPAGPPPLRACLLAKLGSVPLRESGVRHVIEFVAMTYSQKHDQGRIQVPGEKQGAMPLPLDALEQCARLISTRPANRNSLAEFENISSQLLVLLDDGPESDLGRAAAFVANAGILSKRAVGSPGTIGWQVLVEPLHQTITCDLPPRPPGFTSDTIVADHRLMAALKRLMAMAKIRLNPSLTYRLLDPVLLSVWALLAYCQSHKVAPEWSHVGWSLVETYLQQVSNLPALIRLSDALLFDGGPTWVFGPGGSGGVEIRQRSRMTGPDSFFDRIASVKPRTELFLKVLKCGVADDIVMDLFHRLITSWLLPAKILGGDDDPVEKIGRAQLVEGIMVANSAMFSKHPVRLLQLVETLLGHLIEAARAKSKPTISNLVITSSNADDNIADSEILTLTLGLLDTAISGLSPAEDKDLPTTKIRVTIVALLLTLVKTRPGIESSVMVAVRNTLRRLDPTSVGKPGLTSGEQAVMAQQKLLSQARVDIEDAEPPIRAEAVAKLEKLIEAESTVIDPTALATMLLQLINADKDDFVYLRAIRAFSVLASKTGHTTVLVAAHMFSDQAQLTSVDGRLRLAETLVRFVKLRSDDEISFRPDQTDWARAATTIASHAVRVAGRRGIRTREARLRLEQEAERVRLVEEAQDAWGGQVPDRPTVEGLDDASPRDGLSDLDRDLIARLVSGWEETGVEEDVRIRTSALSLLAQNIEVNMGDLGIDDVDAAVDLAIGILALEPDESKAILRRAATHVLESLGRAWQTLGDDISANAAKTKRGDDRHSNRRQALFRAVSNRKKDITHTLGWTARMDKDEMCRTNAQSVIANWADRETEIVREAVDQQRQAAIAQLEQKSDEPSPPLGATLAGLDVGTDGEATPDAKTKRTPGIIELD